MNQQQLILCIDLGSSSVRCSLYTIGDDNAAEPIQVLDGGSTSLAWEAVHPETGKIRWRQAPDGCTLLDLVDQCVDELLEKLPSSSMDIVAVGFSSLVMNLVGVDAEGIPVGDEATLSYACNLPQVATKVKELQSSLGQDKLQDLYQKTGTPMHAAYALPQLCVFYEQQAEQASRVAAWQTLASLCLARWIQCDEDTIPSSSPYCWPISYSEASWTGLLNTQSCQYEPMVIELLPEACRAALPPLADFDFATAAEKNEPPQSLRPPYADRWPALARRGTARFFLGLGDGACANVGSKCTSLDRMACTIGTSAAARVVVPVVSDDSPQQEVPAGLFCYRINRDYLLLGGALTDGGSVVAWIREVLNIASDDEMQQCLERVEALLLQDYATVTHPTDSASRDQSTTRQQRPLVLLPFLSGERSTNFQTGATGAMVGLTRATTRAHLIKACLEGVTMRLAAIARLLPAQAQIWVSGKALEVNTVWRQMIADCTGRVVILDLDTKEGSSRGVACLVAASLSGHGLLTEETTSVSETVPRPEGKAYWDMLVQAQESFVDAMRPIYSG